MHFLNNIHLIVKGSFAQHPVIFAIVFAATGILGGLVGYLMNNVSIKWKGVEFIRSIVFGLVASAIVFALVWMLYSKTFVDAGSNLLNYVLAGCISFMASVVPLLFCYRFAMRVFRRKQPHPPLRIKLDE